MLNRKLPHIINSVCLILIHFNHRQIRKEEVLEKPKASRVDLAAAFVSLNKDLSYYKKI